MSKNKSKKSSVDKSNLTELHNSRDGGQIALCGYTYQFLYSCYLILLSIDSDTIFSLEGIEDIDVIKCCNNRDNYTHIQLKYSTQRQDAGFMDSVLKNYLEVYLIDSNRSFKLVYDFSVCEGNLSKLLSGKLDDSSKEFWKRKIETIKKDKPSWNWNGFDYDDFISKLSFENVKNEYLEESVEDTLIKKYEISVDNIVLYANALKVFCLEKMKCRGDITCDDVSRLIGSVKFDISKGHQNPAHSWIQLFHFLKTDEYYSDYYEGKKATPADIANSLPIERQGVEAEIVDSICKNTITIVKTSSGQGKTTLALRAMFTLQEEYTPYQITCCNSATQLGDIVEYFRMRTRMGEKPLILLDNLDAHLSEWNMLAQLMQTSVTYHYKILVTSRENDWYNYSGDISNLHSLKIVKPVLTEKEAEAIFYSLKNANKLHHTITDWKKSWSKIADRQLLIEYVYLLTHGEMIAERISSQMKEIGNTSSGGTRFEILRKVCFADVCGIRLETKVLISNLGSKPESDIGEILKSLTDEFLVHISSNGDYIEGLHPVRSQHIVARLHEYCSLDETALSIAKIANLSDLAVLFSHYTEFDFEKNTFYSEVVSMWWDLSDLSRFVQAIRGTFSGSVMQYFLNNKAKFDDAYEHGGLPVMAMEVCPFTRFDELEQGLETLKEMAKIFPENKNIQYLIELRNSIPNFNIVETDVYYLCISLFQKIKFTEFGDINDIESYSIIIHWLCNMGSSFDLSRHIDLKKLWNSAEKYSVKAVSLLMYSSFCGNTDTYLEFVEANLSDILRYLKHKTSSHSISIDGKRSVKVEYILRSSEIDKANNESVSRLTDICRTLPIFETYCSDAIMPKIDMLESYPLPNDAHKTMPIKNLIITFHQEFNNLWLNTIQSNYEFDSVYDWIDYWLNVRKCVCELLNASCMCIYKLLEGKSIKRVAASFDDACYKCNKMMLANLSYPREHRPFEKKPELPKNFDEVKSDYFAAIQNFANQLVKFIGRKERFEHLVIYNLSSALAALPNMQMLFEKMSLENEHKAMHTELCKNEEKVLLEAFMCCKYYISNTPSLYFKKYQVKEWFFASEKSEIERLNGELILIKSSYDAIFPKKIYRENTFLFYPIVLKDFDITDDTQMYYFLVNSIPFASSPFDYLILLTTNNEGKVMPNAIKFPKRFFQNLNVLLSSGKEDEMSKFALPYPIEVNNKMVDCFGEDIEIQKQEAKYPWLGCIADLGEELWVYSKNRELLVEDADGQYLCDNLNTIKNNCNSMMETIELSANDEIVSALKEICTDVFSGESFNNEYYNKLISRVQSLYE